MIRGRTRQLLALLSAAVLLSAAACGSDDGDAGDGGSGPIKIMAIVTNIPSLQQTEIDATLETAAKMINASGGIGGRDVKIVSCNAKADPNVTVQCTRQAVDEDVAAVVGGVAFFPTVFPILEKAKIAWIGGFGISAEELNSPASFPVSAGQAGWNYGQAKVLKDLGSTNPVYVTCEPAACANGGDAFSDGWQLLGGEEREMISIPDNQVDLASIAATIKSEGYDGIATGAYPSQVAQLTRELRQQGWEGPIVPHAGVISDENIKTMGEFTQDVYVVGNQLPASTPTAEAVPAMQEYFDALDEYAPGTVHSELGTNTWSAVNLFFDVAKSLDTVDHESIYAALQDISPDDPLPTRLGPDFADPGDDAPLKDYSRLPWVRVAVSTIGADGQLVQDEPGTFLDVLN